MYKTNVRGFSFFLLLLVATEWMGRTCRGEAVELPPLPYDVTALEPVISRRTLTIHHDRHHAKYVATTNQLLLEATNDTNELSEASSLEDIMRFAYRTDNQGLYNNAAQSWNHAFYWNCMKPPGKGGGGEPPVKHKNLLELINKSFGSFSNFSKEFAIAGNTAFGSGWAWLVYDARENELVVVKTTGALNPMNQNDFWIPVLTMDVWEHSYYLDYQNLRNEYVDSFLQKLVNWDFVAQNLEAAMTSEGSGKEEL